MIDSHIHLSYKPYDQYFPFINMDGENYIISYGSRDELIKLEKEAGVSCCIEPAIDVDSNRLLLKLAAEYPEFVYPAVGNHPTRCIRSSVKDFRKVKEFAADEKVIAIGETGLDYHYERKKQHRLRQKMWFKWQIRLAEELKRPLILHIREAHEDAISILRKNKNRLHGGVCHCFVGDASVAKIYTEELGLSLGIGGYLLMQSEESKLLSEVVKVTPIEYLILETDGPFVKPEKPENISKKKWEHARNTSLILPAVASKIAMIKGIMQEEVMRITEENTRRVFMKNKINFVRNTCVLVIEVGEKRFYANFEDNLSAKALIEKLNFGAITVDMHDYGSFEKVGSLPWTLPRSDEQISTAPGDIILYQGDQITIYYDRNSWSFTRLAKIGNASKEELLAALGDGDVSVTLYLEWSE